MKIAVFVLKRKAFPVMGDGILLYFLVTSGNFTCITVSRDWKFR